MDREFQVARDVSNETPRGALMLRRHKMLPRPVKQLDLNLHAYRISSNNSRALSPEECSPRSLHYTKSENGAPQLPPTPPSNSRIPIEDGQFASTPIYFEQNLTVSPQRALSRSTMRSGQSPPTPDFTPPRQSRSTFFSPSQNLLSRSNSFITAPENPYTSDDDESGYAMMTLMLSTPSSKSYLTQSESKQVDEEFKRISEQDLDKRVIRPKIWYSESPPRSAGILDEKSTLANEEDAEENYKTSHLEDQTTQNFTNRARSSSQSSHRPLYANEATETTTGAKFYLSIQPTEYTPVRQCHLTAPQPNYDELEGMSSTRVSETRKSSVVSPIQSTHSGKSSIMQTHRHAGLGAPVYNSQQCPSKRLRHSKKFTSLRECGNQFIQSPEIGNASGGLKNLSNATQPALNATEYSFPRNSSNGTVNSVLSMKHRKEIIKKGGIPVLVIPERTACRLSTKPISLRSTSSHKTQCSTSLNSMPVSHHSKHQLQDHDNYEISVSNVESSPKYPDPEYTESTDELSPSFSLPESTLSTQTTRCTSRNSSLTTDSLRAHNQLLAQKSAFKLQFPPFPDSSLSNSQLSSEISGNLTASYNDDPCSDLRPLDRATPYSQSSYEIAEATAEVSEALAVSLFPRQTSSIVVVPHRTSLESCTPQSENNLVVKNISNSATSDGNEALAKSQIVISENITDKNLDATAQPPPDHNSQNLSGPPVITFHPPTPRTIDNDFRPLSECTLSDSESLDRQISLLDFPMPPSASDSTNTYLSRTISLGSQPNCHINPEHNLNQDSLETSFNMDLIPDRSKLHPFWRPSKFWDDYDESNEFYVQNSLPRCRPYTSPRKSLSERFKKSIGAFPVQKPRGTYHKLTEHRLATRLSNAHHGIMRQRSKSNVGEYSNLRVDEERIWGLDFKEGNGGRTHSFPALGLRIENLGWSEIRRWASDKKREKKKEG